MTTTTTATKTMTTTTIGTKPVTAIQTMLVSGKVTWAALLAALLHDSPFDRELTASTLEEDMGHKCTHKQDQNLQDCLSDGPLERELAPS